ncbi:DUF2141 domain-containing protein [Marivirga sp. S37H4]|uniref:DUF2141 domain-containing protein n=1 Tax=Marivirga aurantiaca TaxID=2802615 RepID=A0A934WVK8_9BACT|nr:DUF2141 domain-containing protein [Marivirga aurantiaca]MBK6263849.1 DUF2141 domain-containing protein [Marivirga aurantiaca]
MKTILIQLLILISTQLHAQENRLTIYIVGLKSTKGQVILDIFDKENGYPMKTENAILRKKLAIPENGKVVFYIDGLENGEYAFALIHDQNNNDKLDVNFIGIPKEGAAASNNAEGFMGPPDYKDAMFNFTEYAEMTIKILYF